SVVLGIATYLGLQASVWRYAPVSGLKASGLTRAATASPEWLERLGVLGAISGLQASGLTRAATASPGWLERPGGMGAISGPPSLWTLARGLDGVLVLDGQPGQGERAQRERGITERDVDEAGHKHEVGDDRPQPAGHQPAAQARRERHQQPGENLDDAHRIHDALRAEAQH